jgi:hypothetical protein
VLCCAMQRCAVLDRAVLKSPLLISGTDV